MIGSAAVRRTLRVVAPTAAMVTVLLASTSFVSPPSLAGPVSPLDATWSRVKTHDRPAGSVVAKMAYDEATGEVVLYDPDDLTSLTWTFDGTRWSPRQTSIPSLFLPAVAYDAARQKVVLFGDYSSTDTWLWNGRTWNRAHPRHRPPARTGAMMAYDAARQQVVLFGGGLVNDTWTWDGSDWTKRTPLHSPSPRTRVAMAYDAQRQVTVLFSSYPSPANDTWTWDGTDWTEQHPVNAPQARSDFPMAYDPATQRVVLFGGDLGGTCADDTWAWDGTDWLRLAPENSPGRRASHVMAYDAAASAIVMFGGWGCRKPGTYLLNTWEYG